MSEKERLTALVEKMSPEEFNEYFFPKIYKGNRRTEFILPVDPDVFFEGFRRRFPPPSK